MTTFSTRNTTDTRIMVDHEVGYYLDETHGSADGYDLVPMMTCVSEAIARQMAVALALRGVGAFYRQTQYALGEPVYLSPEEADKISYDDLDGILSACSRDQGVLGAREMEARSRIGGILYDLAEMADLAENPYFKDHIKEASELLAQATTDQIVPTERQNYGARQMYKDDEFAEKIQAAATAWGVDVKALAGERRPSRSRRSRLDATPTELPTELTEGLEKIMGDFTGWVRGKKDGENDGNPPVVA